VAAAGGLALTGALAAGALVKAFGVGFLGTARTEAARHAHESPRLMVVPMLALSALAAVSTFAAPALIGPVSRAVSAASGAGLFAVEGALRVATGGLERVVYIFGVLAGAAVLLALLRLALLSRYPVSAAVATWDCGYARPTPRMQYTASSFVEPVTTLFAAVLRQTREVIKAEGLFPKRAAYESSTPDPARDVIYRPSATGVDRTLVRLRWLQHGRINLYVLYIAVTLVVLFIWRVGFS
jgi:NADH:ubiquinone oxidoreductase subunit 5 (subunit L)/multisubunit Na+/H+ antiporter MnhA subunit